MTLAEDEQYLPHEYTRAEVIKPHEATDETQINLRVGDIVCILEKDETGWWGGHKEHEDNTGWFPSTCVRSLPGVVQSSLETLTKEVLRSPQDFQLLHVDEGASTSRPYHKLADNSSTSSSAETFRCSATTVESGKDGPMWHGHGMVASPTRRTSIEGSTGGARPVSAETFGVDPRELAQLRERLRAAETEAARSKENEADLEEKNRQLKDENRQLKDENRKLNSSLTAVQGERHHLVEEVQTLQQQLEQETQQLRMQLDQETRYHKETQERAKQALQQANERQRYAEEKLRSYQEERTARPTVCETQNWHMVGGTPQAPSPRSTASPRREQSCGARSGICGRSPGVQRCPQQSGMSSPLSALPPPAPTHQRPSPSRPREGTPSSVGGSKIGGRFTGGGLSYQHSAPELSNSSNSQTREVPPRGCVAEKVSVFEMRCQTPRRGVAGNSGLESMKKAAAIRTDTLDIRGEDHRLRTPPMMPRVGSSPSLASTIAMPTMPITPAQTSGSKPLTVPCDLGSKDIMEDTPEVAEEEHSREVFNMSPMHTIHRGQYSTKLGAASKKNLFPEDQADSDICNQYHRRESAATHGAVQMLVRQFARAP